MENPTVPEDSDLPLSLLFHRTSTDTFFMGSALAEYRAMHGMSDRKLAETLGCTMGTLPRLALCRRPDDQAVRFREDVRRVATFVPCNAERLIELLREVAAVTALRQENGNASRRGVLMAARDRRRDATSADRTRRKKKASRQERRE